MGGPSPSIGCSEEITVMIRLRMKSTGEAIYIIKGLKDPFFRQVYGEQWMYLRR